MVDNRFTSISKKQLTKLINNYKEDDHNLAAYEIIEGVKTNHIIDNSVNSDGGKVDSNEEYQFDMENKIYKKCIILLINFLFIFIYHF